MTVSGDLLSSVSFGCAAGVVAGRGRMRLTCVSLLWEKEASSFTRVSVRFCGAICVRDGCVVVIALETMMAILVLFCGSSDTSLDVLQVGMGPSLKEPRSRSKHSGNYMSLVNARSRTLCPSMSDP